MKVHITGGKGFLGGYVTEALSPQYTVDISDIDTLDVTDLEATIERIKVASPDLVCHLAGVTGANASIKQPHEFFRVNFLGTLNALEACRIAKVKNFIFMSTLTVHGASPESAVNEDSPFDPRHPYAGSKAAAELAVRTYSLNYGLNSAILRATLVAGEGQKEPNAVTEFTQAILNEGVVEIYGDGQHQREWLHPRDLADAVRATADYLMSTSDVECETFIVSSGEPVSMLELAENVISTLGKGEVKFKETTRQAFSLCTTPDKAKTALSWAPKVSVDEIIRRIAKQLDSNGSANV